ncbi:hypothetical protein [Streptomyces sp. NPDC001889]
MLGLRPQFLDQSAPPGQTFLYVDLTLENLQSDRTARPSTLTDGLIFTGRPGHGAGDTLCADAKQGCGAGTRCEHRDRTDSDGRPEELDDAWAPMPAAATYSLRCFRPEPVSEPVDLKRIDLFLQTLKTENGIGFGVPEYTKVPP